HPSQQPEQCTRYRQRHDRPPHQPRWLRVLPGQRAARGAEEHPQPQPGGVPATMVAAWINAEIGVGPAIASGNQVWRGNWALLPATPASTSSAATGTTVSGTAAVATPAITSRMWKLPAWTPNRMMPSQKPTSPTRVTRNAFIAAP